ncbi:MAG TPA: nucleoside diphosphate kinase regulator [Sphingomonadaceae bacterium]|nr:nucleoside diphosphate kinase regulator [Sphingomonadaceae bacterium]
MTHMKATRRPPIHMIDSEAESLSNLAIGNAERFPEASELLLREIDRARLHRPGKLPPGIVTMMSTVEFADDSHEAGHRVQLVYPGQADISAGKLSILTPVGAGLIGLAEGQSIIWPGRGGSERVLTIRKVTQPQPA